MYYAKFGSHILNFIFLDSYSKMEKEYQEALKQFLAYGSMPSVSNPAKDIVFSYPDLKPYPTYNDPDFIPKIISKQEFYRNKEQASTLSIDEANRLKCTNPEFQLSKNQKFVKNFLSPLTPYNGLLLYHGVGVGKCMARDTPILMYNGTIAKIQDIKVGDLIMGDDSTPRKVLQTATGRDQMYTVTPAFGAPYTVNSEHILCLKTSASNTVEIEVKNFLRLPLEVQKDMQGYRVAVEFPFQEVPVDPYVFGKAIRDVESIPDVYKYNSFDVRLKLMTGIFYGFSGKIIPHTVQLEIDILYLAKSLGYWAEVINTQLLVDVYRPCIHDITITKTKVDDYFGFMIDQNGRYLLGDFTVTHNTCTAISVAEQYLDLYKRKVIVVSSGTLVDNFKKQIYDIKRAGQGCTGTKYTDMVLDKTPETLARNIDQLIRQRYQFIGYKELANMIENIKEASTQRYTDPEKQKLMFKAKINEQFSNSLMVIDEAHNLKVAGDDTTKQISKAFVELIELVENVKLLLMTATPMFDTASEIVWLLNLLLINDRRPKLINEKIFNSKTGEINSKLLIQAAKGYVSFMRGENPYTFPIRLFPSINGDTRLIKKYPKIDIYGESIEPIQHLEIIASTMSEYQKNIYDLFKERVKKQTIKDDDDGDEDQDDTNLNDVKNTLQISNIVYPSDIYKRVVSDKRKKNDKVSKAFDECFQKISKHYEYKIKDQFLTYDELANYAPKIKAVIDSIANSEGIVFIYSRYYSSGILPLALALEHAGAQRLSGNIGKGLSVTNKIKGKYVILSKQSDLSPNNNKEIEIVKSPDNMNGELVKIVIVSKIGTEGIDFKNIREVHLLEPWFNLNRAAQIIGRAVRNCSHSALTIDKRNVTVYFHANSYSDNEESVDLRVYRVAEAKQKRIMEIEKILKENAIDCNLNKAVLSFPSKLFSPIRLKTSQGTVKKYNPGDQDGSFICHFQKCEQKCIPEINNDDVKKIDTTTFDDFFVQDDVALYKRYIARFYEDHYVHYFDELLRKMKETLSNPVDEYVLLLALEEMCQWRYIIQNKNDQIGFLVKVGKSFIFQKLDLKDARMTIESRKHFEKKKKLLELAVLESDKASTAPPPAIPKTEDLDVFSQVTKDVQQVENKLAKYNINVSSFTNEIVDSVIDRLNEQMLFDLAVESFKKPDAKIIRKSLKDLLINDKFFYHPYKKQLYIYKNESLIETTPHDITSTVNIKYNQLKEKHNIPLSPETKGYISNGKYKVRSNSKFAGAVCGTSMTLSECVDMVNAIEAVLPLEPKKYTRPFVCIVLELLQRKTNVFRRPFFL